MYQRSSAEVAVGNKKERRQARDPEEQVQDNMKGTLLVVPATSGAAGFFALQTGCHSAVSRQEATTTV